MPPAHVACLAMLEPVMTMREGARIYAPGGTAAPARRATRPARASSPRSSRSPPRAHRASTRARSPRRCSRWSRSETASSRPADLDRLRGVLVGAGRGAVRGQRASSPAAGWQGSRRRSSGCRRMRGRPEPARTLAFLDALDAGPGPETHTTNLVAVDAEGSACVLTSSLGPRLRGLVARPRPAPEQHARRGRPARRRRSCPGTRMESMMAPSLALDGDGPAARDRRRGRDPAPNRAGRRRAGGPRRGPRARRRPSTGRASTAPATS